MPRPWWAGQELNPVLTAPASWHGTKSRGWPQARGGGTARIWAAGNPLARGKRDGVRGDTNGLCCSLWGRPSGFWWPSKWGLGVPSISSSRWPPGHRGGQGAVSSFFVAWTFQIKFVPLPLGLCSGSGLSQLGELHTQGSYLWQASLWTAERTDKSVPSPCLACGRNP